MKSMFIKNRAAFQANALRRDVLDVAEAGLQAISPRVFLPHKVRLHGDVLFINKARINLRKYRKVLVVGIGKAALESARYLEDLLGSRIYGGAIVDTRKGKLKIIKSFLGTHPLPSERNLKATEEIIKVLKSAKEGDLILAIISGGGSSLLFKPEKMSVSAAREIYRELLDSGADIKEVNTVRKHISAAHGGDLIRLARPAEVVGLIFSDVPFKNPALVASGPTFLDKTTVRDAEKIIKKYKLENIRLSETPKDKKIFKKTRNILVLSNADALEAMKNKAVELGYKASVAANFVRGEARCMGQVLLSGLREDGEIVIYGGETVVCVTNKKGRGGRNMELVLGGVGYLNGNQLILSIASDGIDNVAESAGAIADEATKIKARDLGLDPEKYLDNNDSYLFFRKVGGYILSGKTGSNVSDLMLVAQAKKANNKRKSK